MIQKQLSAALAATVLASLVTGCAGGGDGAPQSGTANTSSGTKSAGKGAASAEEVAEEARGRVKCPAKIKTQRGSNAAVIDVVGVMPGMTYDEAANVVMCSHDLLVVAEDTRRGFQLETHGAKIRKGFNARFAKERVEKTSKQILQEMQDNAMARANNRVVRDVLPGESKWYVSTMGLPGEERVINAAREEWFEEGRQPTVTSIQEALTNKYGPPTQVQAPRNSPVQMRWAYDPRGRLITETSPLFQRCYGAADPDVGANVSPDCGVVVAAQIHPLRENPGLGQYLQVGVVDQAGGYELLTRTEQAFQRSEMERRARQLEDASKKAAKPTL
jgi:hypothetical protein